MSTIERELDEPDSKSVLAGMALATGIFAIFEHPAFAELIGASPAWWVYAGVFFIWLVFAYLSYRDDRKKVAGEA